MNKFFFTLGVAALTTLSVFTANAQITEDYENNHVGKIFQQAKVDLNNDGQKETIALKSFKVLEYGDLFAKILVFDANGNIIYRGPEITDYQDNRHIGCFNHGNSNLDLIADIDGDGYLEMLISMPQSDVRPRTYSIWRWNNNKFTYLRNASIMSKDNKQFKFMPSNGDGNGYSFVMGFNQKIYAPGQTIKASVLDFINGYGNYQSKDLLLTPNAQGFRVEQ
ncbi:hypothetical protein IJT10_03865 [bacterium]|nr:hypothetical protein [bacterium]